MWYFKTQLIAEMFENVPEVNMDESFHETFRDKLKLEEQSGSLTISNISTACSGDYMLWIMRDDNDPPFFVVTVRSASPAEQHEMKNKSVTEGDPLSLDSSDIYRGKIGAERVKWFFNGSPMEPEPQEIGDVPLVDSSSGSLIISNTRISDSGEYEVNVIYNRFIIIRRFYVTVNEFSGKKKTWHRSSISRSDSTERTRYRPRFVMELHLPVVVLVLMLATSIDCASYADFAIRHTSEIEDMLQCWVLLGLASWRTAGATELRSVSVTEGDWVTLDFNVSQPRRGEFTWTFGAGDSLLALVSRDYATSKIYDSDKRFRNRLRLDNQTGTLTIMNISSEHAGAYKLDTWASGQRTKKFFYVSVFARVPAPVITRENSSSSHCSLLCSVPNESVVTLSWYKGNTSISSIRVSDFNFSILLHLETLADQNEPYRCVVGNQISSRTQHLDIEKLCLRLS
ncbi:hypothetical protein DNTS_026666, partial [Danionella cerebrum]